MVVTEIKSHFPFFTTHPDITYLDSAATAQKTKSVLDAEMAHYTDCNAPTGRSLYPLAKNATEAFEKAREHMAHFLGAENTASIVFTSGTTMGTNIVAYAWARENLEEGDAVVSTMMEHHANLVPWQILKKERGITLELVEITNESVLDIPDLEKKLSSGRVKLVCVGHVSNVSATLNPIKKIVELAHRAGAAVLVDGAQSTGHMAVDVSEIGMDFFACSGHKMLGPMGTGVLYVHPDRFGEMGVMFGGGDMISRVTPERPWFKPMPTRLEAGTQNVAGAIALAEAARWLNDFPSGLEEAERHIRSLGNYAWEKLSLIPNVRLLGPGPGENSSMSLVSFTFDHEGCPNRRKVKDILLAIKLGDRGICVRSGIFCAQPLMEFHFGLDSAVRASFHVYNDFGDVDRLVEAVDDIVSGKRKEG
jgi:cysteine desulfurase/selenocysteine lyase